MIGSIESCSDIWKIIISFCRIRDWLALHITGNRSIQDLVRRTPALRGSSTRTYPFLQTLTGLQVLHLTRTVFVAVPELPATLTCLSITLLNGINKDHTFARLPASVTALRIDFSRTPGLRHGCIHLDGIPQHIVVLSLTDKCEPHGYVLECPPDYSLSALQSLYIDLLLCVVQAQRQQFNTFMRQCPALHTVKFYGICGHLMPPDWMAHCTALGRINISALGDSFTTELRGALQTIPQTQISLTVFFPNPDDRGPPGHGPTIAEVLKESTLNNLIKLHVVDQGTGNTVAPFIHLLPPYLRVLKIEGKLQLDYDLSHLKVLQWLKIMHFRKLRVPPSVTRLTVARSSTVVSSGGGRILGSRLQIPSDSALRDISGRSLEIPSDSALRDISGSACHELASLPVDILKQLTAVSMTIYGIHPDAWPCVIAEVFALINQCSNLRALSLTYCPTIDNSYVMTADRIIDRIIDNPLVLPLSLTDISLNLGCTIRNVILPPYLRSLTLEDTTVPDTELLKIATLPLRLFRWSGTEPAHRICEITRRITPTVSIIQISQLLCARITLAKDVLEEKQLLDAADILRRRPWLTDFWWMGTSLRWRILQ